MLPFIFLAILALTITWAIGLTAWWLIFLPALVAALWVLAIFVFFALGAIVVAVFGLDR